MPPNIGTANIFDLQDCIGMKQTRNNNAQRLFVRDIRQQFRKVATRRAWKRKNWIWHVSGCRIRRPYKIWQSRQEVQTAGIQARDRTKDHVYLVAFYRIYEIVFCPRCISYYRREVHRTSGVNYTVRPASGTPYERRQIRRISYGVSDAGNWYYWRRAKQCQVHQAYSIGYMILIRLSCTILNGYRCQIGAFSWACYGDLRKSSTRGRSNRAERRFAAMEGPKWAQK